MTAPSPATAPNSEASVVRSGAKNIRGAIRFGSVLLVVAAGLALHTVLLAAGLTGGEPNPGVLLGLLLPCLIGVPGARLIQLARRKQRT
ncbi:hypothetical protein ACFQVC_04150 [Streptomyces monticola]|uniref:Uncharacterized protein n=1 Tax=Streptomyces monticola TaxID=2666263 RepID=A0ABW2JBM1_9ACTN